MPTTTIAPPKAPAKRPSDAEIIDLRFSPESGWKNSQIDGPYWRVNKWVKTASGCGYVAESHFVQVTPDGLVFLD